MSSKIPKPPSESGSKKPKFGVGHLAKGAKTRIKGGTHDVVEKAGAGLTAVSSSQPKEASVSYKSPLIEAKSLELDQQCAFINGILKAQRKQTKSMHGFLEANHELLLSYNTFAANLFEDELCSTMEVSSRLAKSWLDSLRELEKDNIQYEDDFEKYLQKDVAPSRIMRKAFETQRLAMEKAHKAWARSDPAAGQKHKEIEEAREKQEAAYATQGESTFYAVQDTLFNARMYSALQMIENYNHYHKFFTTGLAQLEQDRQKILELQEVIVEEQAAYQAEMKMSRPKGVWRPEGLGGMKRVFQINYVEVVNRDYPDEQILPFLDTAITHLETEAVIQTQGLFRISANKPQLDALRARIDQGDHEYTEEELDDPHMITGIIKLFLRCLPEPLLTFDLYYSWIESTELDTRDLKVAKLRQTVEKLPLANRVLLQRLMSMCTKILKYTEINLMTVQNLAIVLGPSILYDREGDDAAMVQSIQKANSVVVLLVQNFDDIFRDLPMPDPAPAREERASTPRGNKAALKGSRTPAARGTVDDTTEIQRPAPRSNTNTPRGFMAGATTNSDDSEPKTPRQAVIPTQVTPQALNFVIPPPEMVPPDDLPPELPATCAVATPLSKAPNGELIPTLPALPPRALFQSVNGLHKGTRKDFTQLYDLFSTSFIFVRAAFTQDDPMALSPLFSNVSKSIRSMLQMIKDYSSKFPADVAERILQAATEIRPHFQEVQNALKSHQGDREKLNESIYHFYVAVFQVYSVCSKASQMDSICQTGFLCIENAEKFLQELATGQAHLVSVTLNNLQSSTLEFTSLLRARVQEIGDTNIQNQLGVIIETTEGCIGEIFEEGRKILQSGFIESNPLTNHKVGILKKIVTTTLSLSPIVSISVQDAPILDMTFQAIEQLQAVVEIHGAERGIMKEFLEELKKITVEMETITNFFQTTSESPVQQKTKWLDSCHDLVSSLMSILELVKRVGYTISDESLHSTLASYAQSLTYDLVQFQILATAAVWDIRLMGYEEPKCIAPLKDFAFITFPFSYNLRDAAADYERLTSGT